jgi:TetR/AcrR family transcriptional repressor of nem operon
VISTSQLRKFKRLLNSSIAKETIKEMLEFAKNELVIDNQQKGCFMVNAEIGVAPLDPEVNRLLCQNDQQTKALYLQVIQAGKDNGDIKNKQDARAIARFIFSAVKDMRLAAKSTVNRIVFDDIIDSLFLHCFSCQTIIYAITL